MCYHGKSDGVPITEHIHPPPKGSLSISAYFIFCFVGVAISASAVSILVVSGKSYMGRGARSVPTLPFVQSFHFLSHLVSGQRPINRDVSPGKHLIFRNWSYELQLACETKWQ